MEIRHTLKRKNLLSCFSFSNINYLIDNYLARLFKEIKKRISLNNMCLISILQNSCLSVIFESSYPFGPVRVPDSTGFRPLARRVECLVPLQCPQLLEADLPGREIQKRAAYEARVSIDTATSHIIARPGSELVLSRRMVFQRPEVKTQRIYEQWCIGLRRLH